MFREGELVTFLPGAIGSMNRQAVLVGPSVIGMIIETLLFEDENFSLSLCLVEDSTYWFSTDLIRKANKP